MTQAETATVGIDDTIGQVERLYRAMTGTDAPHVESAYAPIPAEKDPGQHVEEQLNRLLDLLGTARPGPEAAPQWRPPLSVFESDSEILVCLDVPGVKREQVEVVCEGNTVTVSGERPREREGFRLRTSDGTLGRFRRTFMVPAGIKGAEPSAQIKDGTLEIRIAKATAESTSPRSVPIR